MQEYVIARYEFNELTDTAKEFAIEYERSNAWNFLPEDMLTDALTYDLGELLGMNSHSHADLELHYSLSYTQGDGVSFTGTLTPADAPLMSWPQGVAIVELVRIDSHYSHAFTVRPEYFDSEGEELDPALFTAFTDEFRQICGQLERRGYDFIEDMTSRERAIETLEDAGAIFLESGKISRPVGLVA